MGGGFVKWVTLFSCFMLLTVCATAYAIVGTQALKLDGKHYVEMQDCEALNSIENQVTLEARIRIDSFTNGWMPLVYKGDKSVPHFAGRSYTLWVSSQGFVYFSSTLKNHEISIGSAVGSVRPKRWYHIAGVIDTYSDQMLLYLNGNLVASARYARQIRHSNLPLLIGWAHETHSGHGYFQGLIDDVRIWNIALTKDQIRATMRKPLTGKENGLVGYWNFDDTTANDLTQNRNNGTLKVGEDRPAGRTMNYRSASKQSSETSQGGFWNLRDIGGIKTADGRRIRTGRVYLSGIPPRDACMELARKGRLQTVISYLVDWEIETFQRYRWTKNDVCNVVHAPFGWTNNPQQWNRDWGRNYRNVIILLLRKHAQPIKRTIDLLADEENYPVIYYDRNDVARVWMMTTLIYLTLGIPEADILELSGNSQRICRPVLSEVRRCGGIENYLKQIGVASSQIERLKQNLLE